MTTAQSKNSRHRRTAKSIWTKPKAARLERAVLDFQARFPKSEKYLAKRSSTSVCLGQAFRTFWAEHHSKSYQEFLQMTDPEAEQTQQLRAAREGLVCLCCGSKFRKTTFLCAACAVTPEGKELRRELTVAARTETNMKRWGAANPMSSVKGKRNHKKKVTAKLGVANAMFLPSVRRKHKKNVQASHRTEECRAKASAVRQVPGFMDKVVASTRATCLAKYGVDNPMKSEASRTKWTKQTKKWKTSKGRAETGARALKAVQDKYGVDNVMELDWVKQKMRQTWYENYGVDHPLKDMDIRKKALKAALSSRFKVKTFECQGRTFQYMGYERPAIEECVTRYGLNNVQANGDIEPIQYGNRLYFPDVYVTSKDTYIEVKSIWTMFSARRSFTHCQEKAKRVNDCGAELRWILCSADEVLVVLPKDWYEQKPRKFIAQLVTKLPEKHGKELAKYVRNWNKYEGRVHN